MRAQVPAAAHAFSAQHVSNAVWSIGVLGLSSSREPGALAALRSLDGRMPGVLEDMSIQVGGGDTMA